MDEGCRRPDRKGRRHRRDRDRQGHHGTGGLRRRRPRADPGRRRKDGADRRGHRRHRRRLGSSRACGAPASAAPADPTPVVPAPPTSAEPTAVAARQRRPRRGRRTRVSASGRAERNAPGVRQWQAPARIATGSQHRPRCGPRPRTVAGSGPGGRIVRADVEHAIAALGSAPAPSAQTAPPVAAVAPCAPRRSATADGSRRRGDPTQQCAADHRPPARREHAAGSAFLPDQRCRGRRTRRRSGAHQRRPRRAGD